MVPINGADYGADSWHYELTAIANFSPSKNLSSTSTNSTSIFKPDFTNNIFNNFYNMDIVQYKN